MILRLIILAFLTNFIQAQPLLEQADSLKNLGNYNEAITLLERNLDQQNQKDRYIFQSVLATLYGQNMEYEKAFGLQEKAIRGLKEMGNDTLTSRALYGLAKLFSDRFEYDKQIKYLKQALTFSRTPVDSARIISNMGVYFRNNNQLDSARNYYLNGIALYPKEEDQEFFLISFHNLAILEKSEGNYDRALDYYEKAKAISIDLEKYVQASAIEVNKTYIYYDLKEFQKAEEVLNANEAEIMAKGTTLDKLNFDLIRYNIADKLGKSSETLQYYKRYRKTKDSVDNLKLNTQIAEFEVKYESAEKEREIALRESELAKSKVQKQYLWGGLIGAIWLGLFGTLFYWSRNRYQKKLTEEKLHSLAIASMLDGQENERLRIAKDLHDSLGGLLTTIKLHFEGLQLKLSDWVNHEKTDNLTNLLDKASKEVRRISHNMAPRALNLSGLNSALADLSTEINTAGSIDVSYEWNGDEIFEQDRIMVYRIVEEACNNVLKHAKAEHLFIQVNVFDDGYSVLVEDDGCGFDEEDQQGMGLRNIRSRASILKAELSIDSQPGKGTSILLSKNLEE